MSKFWFSRTNDSFFVRWTNTCNNKIGLCANLQSKGGSQPLKDSKGKFKMLYWNCRDLRNKIVNLSLLASLKQSDVICIAEHWLAESEVDSVILYLVLKHLLFLQTGQTKGLSLTFMTNCHVWLKNLFLRLLPFY